MPDTTLKQTIVTDDSQMLAALQRIRQQYGALEAKMQEVVEGHKRGHNEFTAALREQASELTGMVTKYGSVAVVVHEVIGAYREWRTEMQEAAREQKTVVDEFVAGMARIGNVAGGTAQAKEEVERMMRGGATKPQAQAAYFAGISTASPLVVPLERQQAIAREGAKDAWRFGENTALLAQHVAGAERMAEIVPGSAKAPYDVLERLKTEVGVAKVSELSGGEYSGAVKALISAGMPFGEAAETGALALQRNIPLGLLTQIAAKANAARTPRPRHWGQRPKPEDLAYNRFATAETPYDAIQMALEDPEVQEAVLGQRLGGRIGGKNPRITMAEIRAGAEWIAVPGGLDVARADQRHSEEGRRAIVDQAGAKSVELQKEANAELNREEAKYTEWVKLVKRTNAPWRRPGIGMVAETAWALRGDYSSAAGDVGYFVGMDREAATANFEHFAGLATETSRQRWRERLPRANWGIPDPIHDRKEAQVDRMLEDPQMTEQTELLREVLSARGSDFDLALATFMQSIAGE